MLKYAFVLAAASSVAVAAPAYAADVTTLSCVNKTVDTATRAQLENDIEKNLANAGGEQSYSPSTISGLRTAAKTCQGIHGWSDEATSAAILYSVPVLAWPVADRMARAGGIEPQLIEKRFMALPETERAAAMETPATFQKIAVAAIGAGEVNEGNATLAGGLLGLLAVREKGLYEFKTN